jgi:hypothetical protein
MSPELTAAIGSIASILIPTILKRIWREWFQTPEGDAVMRQIPIVVGAIVGFFFGEPESGALGGVGARAAFEVGNATAKHRVKKGGKP